MYHRRHLLQDTAVTSSPSPRSTSDVSPSVMVTVLILAIAVILSASLYLLLRFLRRSRTPTTTLPRSFSAVSPPSLRQVTPIDKNPLIDTLPLFTFDSLSSKTTSGDCAVCLSKFHRRDLLRLLPICCHAFHAECIDTWLSANMTCPLCRSPIFLPENEILKKLSGDRSESFRVELGNVGNHRTTTANSGEIRRSYSLGGSFDYIVDDGAVSEIPAGSFRMTSSEFNKVMMTSGDEQQLGVLAGEVGRTGGGGGWLKDYLSNSISSSRTASFRGSGRWFFTGSSRRSNPNPNPNIEMNEFGEMEEASRLGNEIGELFRWLSGV